MGHSRFVVPYSNLDGTGPLPVGTTRGVSVGGVSDIAGNVREWCVNDAGHGERFILGGGWSDRKYAFVDATRSPDGSVCDQWDPARSLRGERYRHR